MKAGCAPGRGQPLRLSAFYHPTHGGIKLLRGDRLLDPDDDSEWVFYEHESRRDDGPVGWYHRSSDTFDPTCHHPHRLFERSSRAKVERWRLDWIAKHDPKNVFNDDCSMVSADGDGGVFPVELSYVHLGSVRHADANVYHLIDARISAATRTFGALKTVLRSRYAHLRTKHRVYVGAVLPVLLYGCESWLVDVAALQRLVVFHNDCVRGICGINRCQVREGRNAVIELLRRLTANRVLSSTTATSLAREHRPYACLITSSPYVQRRA